jgi:hypothetical protein
VERYQDWLKAPVAHSMAFMRLCPADLLQASQPALTSTPLFE